MIYDTSVIRPYIVAQVVSGTTSTKQYFIFFILHLLCSLN
jgi:hypothetical protein